MITTELPTINSYGEYSSDNYGMNTLKVTLPKIELWFSYKTIVAFRTIDSYKVIVRENDWKQTTGKHLNWIDGGNKRARISGEEFERQLQRALEWSKI